MPPREFKTNEQASGAIRRDALAAGARKIRLCTQAYGTLKEHLKGEKQGGGICRSLVIGWLADRKSGKDFFTALLGAGGKVNADMVAPMVKQYEALGKVSQPQERAYVSSQLSAKGLKAHGCQYEMVSKIAGPVGHWYMQTAAHGPIGPLRVRATRTGYDHAMGLDLRVAKAPVFFDPNWGEFEFPDYGSLAKFLSHTMFLREGTLVYYCGMKSFAIAEKSNFS